MKRLVLATITFFLLGANVAIAANSTSIAVNSGSSEQTASTESNEKDSQVAQSCPAGYPYPGC